MPSSRAKVSTSSSEGGFGAVSLCSVAVVTVSIVIGLFVWLSPPSPDATELPNVKSETVVERKRYDGKSSYKEIAEMREPMILTGTIVDRWPARKHFTTKFLASKIKHVKAHIQENDRTFITFHDNKPLEEYVTERWADFNVKINTTIPNVLQWDKDKADPLTGPFLYYTQDLATMSSQFSDVIGYVQPIKELILSEENVQVNLWVGREGLVTHTHYDCSYNFFFQLQGRKRFTLFPPSEPMYLYPCLHPHYGHSQVDILNPDYETFPLFKSAQRVVAEVRPGDMLVVPPFWYHHVETLAESVSVNVWSDAPEYEIVNKVYSLPVPFEDSWSERQLIIATKLYIDMVLVQLEISSTDLQHSVLNERYKVLLTDGYLKLNYNASKEVTELCNSKHDWSPYVREYKPMFEEAVSKVVELFHQITVRSTLEICVANFVEHLIHSVVGLDLLYPFLSHCSTFLCM